MIIPARIGISMAWKEDIEIMGDCLVERDRLKSRWILDVERLLSV